MTARSRRWLTIACWLGTAMVACGAPQAPPARPGPHVVLVVIDTLRADRLSQYGHRLETGRGLEPFAREAHRFEHAYAVSPRTGPSTATLFTGLAPGTHGVTYTAQRLSSELDTLTERLKRAGWQTVGFSHNAVVGNRTGFGQGFDRLVDFEGGQRAYPDVSVMVEEAIRWLESRGDGPFFLYLHPMNVHGPYRTPEERASDLLGRPPRPGFEFYGPLMKDLMRGDLGLRASVTPEMLASLREHYDTAVRYTCDQIARVFDRLRDEGIYDDSLVILTADHGEELFDHGGLGHAYTLYREVLRVPLLIKLPGQTRGRSIDLPVSLLDVHPTVLDLLGLEVPANLQGRSFAGALRGQPEDDGERALYFQEDSRRMSGRGLQAGRYKLIEIDRDYEQREGVRQLFDLERDPLETVNLAAEKPAVVEDLARRLEARARRYRRPGARAEDVRDEMDEELLRELGYAE